MSKKVEKNVEEIEKISETKIENVEEIEKSNDESIKLTVKKEKKEAKINGSFRFNQKNNF